MKHLTIERLSTIRLIMVRIIMRHGPSLALAIAVPIPYRDDHIKTPQPDNMHNLCQ